jgi:hypothetical protein
MEGRARGRASQPSAHDRQLAVPNSERLHYLFRHRDSAGFLQPQLFVVIDPVTNVRVETFDTMEPIIDLFDDTLTFENSLRGSCPYILWNKMIGL